MKTGGGPTPAPIVAIEAITAARARIAPFVVPTPLIPLPSREGIFLKPESFQVTGSFKVRGAASLITHQGAVGGVVTGSSGNHGQAVAYVAARLGVPATVVVPDDIPSVKAEGIARWGARLIRHGRSSEERIGLARRLAADERLLYVPPFDDTQIMAGQGTIGLEIIEQLPTVGTVVVPVSGGGLIGGIASAVKQHRPNTAVVGVEPASLARFARSRAEGRPVRLPFVPTIADGLRVQEPGRLTWAVAEQYVDRFVSVEDVAMLRAVRTLALHVHLVVEPSGAAPLAALDHLNGQLPVVLVLSGGNIDPQLLISVLQPA